MYGVYLVMAIILISLLSGIAIEEKQFAYAASNAIAKTTTSSSSSLHGFSFAAAGDWACNSNTINTVKNIEKKNPNLILGAHFFPLYGKAPYTFTQYLAHGILDVAITNNGKTLSTKFYDNDGSVRDQFTIKKSIMK